MSFELDILAVGDETTSGDAIALRYGSFSNEPRWQRVVVIDGGFADSGSNIVSLLQRVYGTNYVDLIVSTHPHDDHVNGLHVVFDELKVGALWMHRPWLHADSVRTYVQEKRITSQRFSERLKRSLENAYALEQAAIKKSITPVEPFTGLAFDKRLFVIGPTRDYYERLVCEFGEAVSPMGKFAEFFEAIPQKASEARRRISEALQGEEQLVDPAINDVNARNNSSVILIAQLDDSVFLFTADAGVPALTAAA